MARYISQDNDEDGMQSPMLIMRDLKKKKKRKGRRERRGWEIGIYIDGWVASETGVQTEFRD
jgi:hypothetical protein